MEGIQSAAGRKVAVHQSLVMDKSYTVLLLLLRAGLWNTPIEDVSFFPLNEKEWERLFQLACQQTVQGVVYEGIYQLPDDCLPPDALLFRWVAEVDVIERRNRLMNDVLKELTCLFVGEGLHPVLQKGQGIARCYRQPLRRVCGDIDFYFPESSERVRALEILDRLGVSVRKAADGSVNYLWKGIVVEHHKDLLDVSNPFVQRSLHQWEKDLGFLSWNLPSGDCSLRVPSSCLELLLLSTHIRKHAFGWGIGLRQLCDYACACGALTVDESTFCKLCSLLDLHRWQETLHGFIVYELGVHPEKLPIRHSLGSYRTLSQIIYQSGNFGQNHRVLKDKKAERSLSGDGWRQKIQTANAMGKSLKLAFRYGLGEYFWMWVLLIKGQWKN